MRGKDFGAERTQQEEAACGAKETEKMGMEDAVGHATNIKTPFQVMHLSKLVSTPVRGVTRYLDQRNSFPARARGLTHISRALARRAGPRNSPATTVNCN